MKHLLSYSALIAISLTVLSGADWLQFRGSENGSVAAGDSAPTAWNVQEKKNIAWQADLPGRGVSGPIVVGDKVVVTCSSGYNQDRLHVLCFDVASGQPAWSREFWATGRTLCHPTSAVAANTPASDGKQIYAFYSSNDLICLDLDGNLKWFRGLTHDHPAAANDVGLASSPLVIGDTVVVQIENQSDSFAAGIDTRTGETRWRLDRPRAPNWTSPVLLPGKEGEQDLVLLQSSTSLSAHDPATGKQVWEHQVSCGGIPSATVAGDVIFVPAAGLTALKRDASSQATQALWSENKLGPGSASPVAHADKVYVLNRGGVLTCGDAKDGKVLWALRLGGTFWATPIVAGDHLYAANQDGVVRVVKLGEKGEIVSENDFGEGILGSPAASEGALYFRSDAHLWKVAGE